MFGEPPFHLVGLSGGKDSTALALALRERNPSVRYCFYCTPTGRELPEMFDWWNRLSQLLGSPIAPIMRTTLAQSIERNRCLPNHRIRFCTREIKIEPVIRLMSRLVSRGEVHSYVGLRADEEGRAGGAFDQVPGVEVHFPFREWNWGLVEVWRFLQQKNVASEIPVRTDCDLCFHQRIGEWWRLWKNYPDRFQDGVALEEKYNQTFRTPGRDSWPTKLAEMRAEFEKGKVPKGEAQTELFGRSSMSAGTCRVCSL